MTLVYITIVNKARVCSIPNCHRHGALLPVSTLDYNRDEALLNLIGVGCGVPTFDQESGFLICDTLIVPVKLYYDISSSTHRQRYPGCHKKVPAVMIISIGLTLKQPDLTQKKCGTVQLLQRSWWNNHSHM